MSGVLRRSVGPDIVLLDGRDDDRDGDLLPSAAADFDAGGIEKMKNAKQSIAEIQALTDRVKMANRRPPIERTMGLEREELAQAQAMAAEWTVENLGETLAKLHEARALIGEDMLEMANRYRELEERRVDIDRSIRVAAAAVAYKFEKNAT